MSEPVVTPGTTTVVVDQSAPKPAATPAVVTQTAPEGEPNWLPARLERERRQVLKDLGVESIEDGKKAIAEINAKRESEKTAAEKASDLDNKLKAANAEKATMAETLATYAKSLMGGLTEAQKSAVIAIAGEDASKQLKAIEALTPTWQTKAPDAAAATATAVATQKPVVADTAPAKTAPGDTPTTSPPDPKAIHAELLKTNPVVAARYAVANGIFDK